MNVYAQRCTQLQARLKDEGSEALLVGASADLRYLAGYAASQSERLTCFVVPADGTPFMVIPAFEAPRLGAHPWFTVLPWNETDDAAAILASHLAVETAQAHVFLVGDRTWAAFLMRFQSIFPKASWQSATPLLRELRMLKSPSEIAALRTAGAQVDAIFQELVSWRWQGRTEVEIADAISAGMRDRGCESVDFVIVGSGPNGASPHYSGGDRVIEHGDTVILDYGGPFGGGYFADITRTVVVGAASAEVRKVYDVVRAAQEAGVQAVLPGVACQSVDAAARAVITASGYGPLFNHRTGHGIGLDGHEEPYMVAGNALHLAPGMTFSVEPGIYLPGRFGVRIEDIVACTEDGVERLNTCSRELVVVH
jgi:Xaa-Pro aminopeptidase